MKYSSAESGPAKSTHSYIPAIPNHDVNYDADDVDGHNIHTYQLFPTIHIHHQRDVNYDADDGGGGRNIHTYQLFPPIHRANINVLMVIMM